MTDVSITLEDCEHALTQPEALSTANELIELVHKAQEMDSPPPPKILIKNGRVDMATIRAVMARVHNRPNLVEWHTNALWSALVHSFWLFEVYCISCSKTHRECRCKYKYSREHYCIPVDQIFGHYWEFGRRKPAISHDYYMLALHLSELTSS